MPVLTCFKDDDVEPVLCVKLPMKSIRRTVVFTDGQKSSER